MEKTIKTEKNIVFLNFWGKNLFFRFSWKKRYNHQPGLMGYSCSWASLRCTSKLDEDHGRLFMKLKCPGGSNDRYKQPVFRVRRAPETVTHYIYIYMYVYIYIYIYILVMNFQKIYFIIKLFIFKFLRLKHKIWFYQILLIVFTSQFVHDFFFNS